MSVKKSITAYPVDITREIKELAYHLYTPSETIERARSRLGEDRYNLIVNNCEHFAIWCKTGIHESHQVNGLIDILSNVIVKY